MDTKTILGIIVAIIIIIGAIVVLGGQGGEKRIDIVGSTSVQPVAEKLAAEYMKKTPGR